MKPKKITPEGGAAEDPIWLPDSKGMIALGAATELERPGWLYLPIDGSKPSVCVSSSELQRLGFAVPPLQFYLRPAAIAQGSIIFAARTGGTSGLWRLPVSASDCHPTAAPIPLTAGLGFHSQPSVAAGSSQPRYVFSVLSLRSSIVSIPATGATSQSAANRKHWTEGQDLNTVSVRRTQVGIIGEPRTSGRE